MHASILLLLYRALALMLGVTSKVNKQLTLLYLELPGYSIFNNLHAFSCSLISVFIAAASFRGCYLHRHIHNVNSNTHMAIRLAF